MFGNGDFRLEAGLCNVFITDEKGKRQEGDEIIFSIHDGERYLKAYGQNIAVTMSKEEAKDLAIFLLKQAGDSLPDRGVVLHNSQGADLIVAQALDETGSTNTPILSFEKVTDEDIAENGTLSACLTNGSARKLIEALAKIV